MASSLSILRAQPKPRKFHMSRLLMRTGLSTLFLIEQDGFRLRFFPSSLSAALWIDPDDRRDDVAFFREYLRPGDTVIDAGANVGVSVFSRPRSSARPGGFWPWSRIPGSSGFCGKTSR